MTTYLETIEAAIAKLEILRRESTQDVWITGSTQSWEGIPPLTRAVTFHGYENADAELIIALHRTINAQVAILSDAVDYLKEDQDYPRAIYGWVARASELARAILDETPNREKD